MPDTLIDRVRSLLDTDGGAGRFAAVLDEVLRHFGGVVGTLHGLDAAGATLLLVAERGLPPGLKSKVERIPVGKGMAGLAAERRAPVQVCNLQTDESGVAKPSARETQVAGSITVPLLDGATLRGTLGVAQSTPHEFTPGETELLLACGALIARALDG
ncbi:MAG TPA: GAF domain-containing protein [Polyangia bacterium]|nr:GAF domain-containing protein [Polyangia bacterium]